MNPSQKKTVDLSPEAVDCIVFWTKNPAPMLGSLDMLGGYPFYFQFTVTPYDADVEPGVPSKYDAVIPSFRRLSDMIGADRVIWRYDPILLSEKYTVEYHKRAFAKMALLLSGYTKRCTISFVDRYRKTEKNMKQLGLFDTSDGLMAELGGTMAETARSCGMAIDSCAEKTDLSRFGIEHGSCIDGGLIEKITGRKISAAKDKNQRPECGCVASVDIGAYDTCRYGCRYCYANR